MSAYVCNDETYHDLIAWLSYGRLSSDYAGKTPGAQLLNYIKYTDGDLIGGDVIGYHDTITAEIIRLQKGRGKRSEEEATGLAVAHALYEANVLAVAGRYRESAKGGLLGWAHIVATMPRAYAAVPRAYAAQVATWPEVNALEVLRQWNYQASEEPAERAKAHTSLMIAVGKFMLALAMIALETGQRKPNRNGGWHDRISNATGGNSGPVLLSALIGR